MHLKKFLIYFIFPHKNNSNEGSVGLLHIQITKYIESSQTDSVKCHSNMIQTLASIRYLGILIPPLYEIIVTLGRKSSFVFESPHYPKEMWSMLFKTVLRDRAGQEMCDRHHHTSIFIFHMVNRNNVCCQENVNLSLKPEKNGNCNRQNSEQWKLNFTQC